MSFSVVNRASLLQALLLLLLVSAAAAALQSIQLAAAVAAVFGAAALYAAFGFNDECERRAALASCALVFVLAAFIVFYASLDEASRASNLFLLPLFAAAFIAFFFAAKRFLFNAPVKARVLRSSRDWLVVRVEPSLAAGVAQGVYAARLPGGEGVSPPREGSVVRVRFKQAGVLGSKAVEAIVVG